MLFWRTIALAMPFAIVVLVGLAVTPLFGAAAGAFALLAVALVVGWTR